MNPDLSEATPGDCSSIQVDIILEESWIHHFLEEQQTEIPINEQYTLTNLKIILGDATLNFQADLKGKEGTSMDVTSTPIWNAEDQTLRIENLDINTNSRNFLLKSAGWLAQNILGSRIDAKIEEQANRMYAKQLEKLKSKPVEIPLPKGGTAKVSISNIIIHELDFRPQALHVRATIDAFWNIHLFHAE